MDQKVFKKRIYLTGIIIFSASLYLIINLFSLHFSRRVTVEKKRNPDIIRGVIRDRNGDVLALSIEVSSLYANSEEIKNREDIAGALSPIIRVPAETILEKIRKKKRFIWIKRKLSEEEAAKIRKLGARGLYFKKEYRRLYPNNTLASNIIGFSDIDNKGLEGIEFKFDQPLSGSGMTDDTAGAEEIKSGKGIVLTIDKFIQHISERAIENAVKEHRAKQGAAVVMEVRTGRILAAAKYPNINPNFYSTYPDTDIKNFTVVDSFEPGSTMKIFSVAAMIENNPEILKKSFICRGKIDLYDNTIHCTDVHGKVDVAMSVRYSCNVGIIEAAKSIGKEKLFETLKRFNFGRSLNSGFPGESEGILREPSQWSGLSKYSISIGHELSVTSIQMASALNAVANRGIYMYPSIVQAMEDGSGTVVKKYGPVIQGRVISEKTSQILMEMMRDVVEKGSGTRAFSRNYPAAGKTGTSRKYSRKVGEYSDRVISSFIGVVPAENPEISIYVIIDEPAEREHGGTIAAPVFREIAERVLPRMGIKKSSGRTSRPVKEAPAEISFDGNRMPDFTGSGTREALLALSEMKRRLGLDYTVTGTGRVVDQKPGPGVPLDKKKKIELFLKEDAD